MLQSACIDSRCNMADKSCGRQSSDPPIHQFHLSERNKAKGAADLDTTNTSFDSSKTSIDLEDFSKRLSNFIQKTEEHALQATNPGGYYSGLWCRDSSYILKDWFLSGRTKNILNEIL